MLRLNTFLPALGILLLALAAPAQWTNDPLNGYVTLNDQMGHQYCIRTCALAGGRTFIGFLNERYQPVRLHYQLLDPEGNPLLPRGGVPLISGNWTTTWQSVDMGGRIFPDGEGGCIAIFSDWRNGENLKAIYAQRFDARGAPLWEDNGRPLVLWPGVSTSIKDVVFDSLGNGFIGYIDVEYGNADTYAQKINGEGDRLWGEYGVPVSTAIYHQYWPQIVPDEQGGMLVVWQDDRLNFMSEKLYVQHLDADGNPLLAVNGIPLLQPGTGQMLAVNGLHEGVVDGAGGGIWAYDTYYDWFLVRVDSHGRVKWLHIHGWPTYCNLRSLTLHPTDSLLWVCTNEWDTPASVAYLHIFNRRGQNFTGNTGIALPGNGCHPAVYANREGIIALSAQNFDTTMCHLYATRFDRHGDLIWSHDLSVWPGPLSIFFEYPQVCSDGSDGMVCSWQDTRNYNTGPNWNYGVFAQRIHGDGTLGDGVLPAPPPGQVRVKPEVRLDAYGDRIQFALESPAFIRLELYDLLGRRIATLLDAYQLAGAHSLNFKSEPLPSGIYLLQLTTPSGAQTAKVAVVR